MSDGTLWGMSELVVGRTYFRLTFADRDFTMPGVEPLVYVGEFAEDGRRLLAFQDTVSYVRFGSRFEMSEPNDEIVLELVDPEAVGESILGVDAVAHKVTEAARRAEALGYPNLSIVRPGWIGNA